MRTCQHGVEWKSTKVWNTNCGDCRAAAEAYEADNARVHAWALKNADGGGPPEPYRITNPREADGLAVERSEMWIERRQRGIANREAKVKHILANPPDLADVNPGVDMALKEHADQFTPLQREALTYRYGYRLTQREAAAALGITRDAYRGRLDLAEFKLRPLLAEQRKRGEWRWVWVEFKTEYGRGLLMDGKEVTEEEVAAAP